MASSLFAHRGPLAGRMDQGQYPQRFAVDFVYQAIALVRDEFSGAGNLPGAAQRRVLDQMGCRIAERLIHPDSRTRVIGRDVIPYIGTILLRL